MFGDATVSDRKLFLYMFVTWFWQQQSPF